jgi:hypothetical protein
MEDDKPTDKRLRDLYIRRASDKERWVDKAEDLLHAASFLSRRWRKSIGLGRNSWEFLTHFRTANQPKLRSFGMVLLELLNASQN